MSTTKFRTYIFPVLLLLPSGTLAQANYSEQAVLSNDSKLTINGKSNVNDFSCISKQDLEKDSLNYSYEYSQHSVSVSQASLTLKVDEFDCGKKGINKDFKNTLKHEEYPDIEIKLQEVLLSQEPLPSSVSATILITIAGIQKEQSVSLTIISLRKDKIIAEGVKTLNMSDFNLDPPSPLFGLIKVKDELDITFNLIILLSND